MAGKKASKPPAATLKSANSGRMLYSAAALVALALAVAAALLLQRQSADRLSDACRDAEVAVEATLSSWPLFASGGPLALAASLAPAFDVLASDAPDPTRAVAALGASAARCCGGGAADGPGCAALVHSAFPLLAFMGRLRSGISVPRHEAQQSAPRAARVTVVGGGPAGLTAALVAHREGADVTLLEKRNLEPNRPVWFDLEPEERLDVAARGQNFSLLNGGATTQAQLRAWGFF